jgi:hypothetical protein
VDSSCNRCRIRTLAAKLRAILASTGLTTLILAR